MLVNKGIPSSHFLSHFRLTFAEVGQEKSLEKTTLDDAKVTRKMTMEKFDTGELARIAREDSGQTDGLVKVRQRSETELRQEVRQAKTLIINSLRADFSSSHLSHFFA